MPTPDELRALLEEAHGFAPPAAFLAGWSQEVLPGLLLTDLEFMAPASIAAWDHAYGRRRDVIPFAHSARMDIYAWDLAGAPAEPPVLWSPREDREATRFAPDFAGFLFRVLLLEFSGSWLWEDYEPEDFAALQARHVAAVAPWVGPVRQAVLEEVLARGFEGHPEDESVAVALTEEEALALAEEHLGPGLDEPVEVRRPGWP